MAGEEFSAAEWPQLNWLREPVQRIVAPRVFANAAIGGSEVVTVSTGAARTNEVLDAPLTPGRRAYPLRYAFDKNAWPVLFVWFDPSQHWEKAAAVTLDAGLPAEVALAGPLTFRVILEGVDGKYDTARGVAFEPGWKTFRFPLAERIWVWRGKGARTREVEQDAVRMERLGPVNAVSIMLEGWNRTESGIVWFDRLQLV